jgi:hypothetical protein
VADLNQWWSFSTGGGFGGCGAFMIRHAVSRGLSGTGCAGDLRSRVSGKGKREGVLIMTVFIITLMLGLFPARALAAPPDVLSIVKQMKGVFEPARPSTRKIVISVKAGNEKVQWVAAEGRKELPDGKRMVVALLAPKSLRGAAYLIEEPRNKPALLWVYLPALLRLRELLPVDAYEHFLGTDFTYADLGFVRLHENYKLLGEEEHDGVRAYKVEEQVPKERAYYSRLITWVATDSMLPLERDYYDVAGRLWKRELFDEVSVIDGIPTPLRIRMQDLQAKTSTELDVSEVRYDVDIPDSVFDPEHLPELAEHPLWNAYGSRAIKGE